MNSHHAHENTPGVPRETEHQADYAQLGQEIQAAYEELSIYNSPEYTEFEVAGIPTVFDEHGLSVSAIIDGGLLSTCIEVTNPIAGEAPLIYTKAVGVDAWSFNRPGAMDRILTNQEIATRLRDLLGIVDRDDPLLRLLAESDDEHRQYTGLYDTIISRSQTATYRQEITSHILLDAYADADNRIVEDDGSAIGVIKTNGMSAYFMNVPMTVNLNHTDSIPCADGIDFYRPSVRELKVTCRAELSADGDVRIFVYYLDETGNSHPVKVDDEAAIAEYIRTTIPDVLSAKCI